MRRLRVPSTALKTLSSPSKIIRINYIENKLKSSTYRTVPPTMKLEGLRQTL
jgi:hypothetical protein